jgi:hypothetical protein
MALSRMASRLQLGDGEKKTVDIKTSQLQR